MSPTRRSRILRGAPYFLVPDVAAAGAYYRDVCGFECEYAAGDPPEFAICKRDGAQIMFRRAFDPGLIGIREFAVRDPNGYVLGFGEELPR